jgi:hypothetical protein
MSREVVSIANRQRLDVDVGGPKGANRLLIYTGTVILSEFFGMDNRLVRDTVDIILGPNSIADPNAGDNFAGAPFSPINAVASVALATVQELGESDTLTWAVDEATIEEVFVNSATKYLKINTKIAYQGDFAGILRLSYHADVLAIASDPEPQLKSFTLIPDQISTPLTHVGLGVSRGTVTLDGPAPTGGVLVNFSAKLPVPNLVSFPANIIIAAGQSSAIFDVTTSAPPMAPTEILILASLGTRALAAKLTVR